MKTASIIMVLIIGSYLAQAQPVLRFTKCDNYYYKSDDLISKDVKKCNFTVTLYDKMIVFSKPVVSASKQTAFTVLDFDDSINPDTKEHKMVALTEDEKSKRYINIVITSNGGQLSIFTRVNE
jgi:hypothetical protein